MYEKKGNIYLYNHTTLSNYFYLNTMNFASSKPKVLRNLSVSSLSVCNSGYGT